MKLFIETVQEKPGFLPRSYSNSSRYQSNRMVKNTWIAKTLLINGVLEDGRKVFFYTPSTIISKGSGMVNYQTIHKGNDWFTEQQGELIGHENPFHYEGSTEMPIAIENTTAIIPAVQPGQEIDIKFGIKKEFKTTTQLNRVKLH